MCSPGLSLQVCCVVYLAVLKVQILSAASAFFALSVTPLAPPLTVTL